MFAVMESKKVRAVFVIPEELRWALRIRAANSKKGMTEVLIETMYRELSAEVEQVRRMDQDQQGKKKSGK
jgi:plasmid stability protein